MADDVMFNFGINDRASGTLKKIKREADGAQGSLSKTAKAMSLGGEALGKYGERFKKFSELSGGFGALGLAAASVGIAFTMMENANRKSIEGAKNQVSWQQRLREEIKQTTESARAFKAAGVSQSDDVGKLIGRGGNIESASKMVDQGIEETDAMRGESVLLLIRDAKKREAVRKAAADVALLHESSYTDAIEKISKLNGPISSDRGLLAVTGQRVNSENLNFAKNRLNLLKNPKGELAMLNKTRAEEGKERISQARNLVSGESLAALIDINREKMAVNNDPRSAALKKMREAADKLQESLQASARAQSQYFAYFQDGLEAVNLGDGSESTKLANHRRDTAVIRD